RPLPYFSPLSLTTLFRSEGHRASRRCWSFLSVPWCSPSILRWASGFLVNASVSGRGDGGCPGDGRRPLHGLGLCARQGDGATTACRDGQLGMDLLPADPPGCRDRALRRLVSPFGPGQGFVRQRCEGERLPGDGVLVLSQPHRVSVQEADHRPLAVVVQRLVGCPFLVDPFPVLPHGRRS